MPGYFAKKYNTAFTGIGYTGYMAYNPQGVPIAFYAVIPCFIKCGGEIILAAQSADTMTHPDHRNKGLFIELALTTFQLCRDLNIRLLFGFPNQNSLPGFVNKLDWQVAHTMDCFIIHAGSFPFKTIMGKIPLLNKLYTKYQQHTLTHYFSKQTGISNSVFENGYGGIYRDESYLKYKAYGNTSVLQTGNSLLWIKFSEILLIGDILVQPDDFDDMIYTLKKLARKLGIRQIHFHTSPGTTLHGLFAMRFNSTPSFPVIFKVLGDDLQTGKIKFTSADIDTF
ncbi:hypothetical protein MuYL_3300 [Mucilaginibacter xinganensis]|uniref:Uncharacterized protein n=1 Tax=Mucilaginibacter xinganensis TaxID=1234841 RepID=A0A223NZA3_9SPHI|nr:hypothetical protein MuYL_3300 [Mucilaginibacter xinganensis]